MIPLKEMSRQQVYETVVKAMANQGRQSSNFKGSCCLYRAPDGAKCAVGCLIPDEAYDELMEYKDVDNILSFLPEDLRKGVTEHMMLLKELQSQHDSTWTWRDKKNFRESFSLAAKIHTSLDPSFIQTLEINIDEC